MTATGGSGVLTWYDNDPLLGANVLGTGGSLTPLENQGVTTYYVNENLNGCEGPASMITIELVPCELVIPSAITPGVIPNETWQIENLDDVYPNNIVTIYNRWGNLIFEHASDPNNPYSLNPWDGTYNGQDLPVASYYYIIQRNDDSGEAFTGSVTIIRNK
jgi:gliding motility-associated-like protein